MKNYRAWVTNPCFYLTKEGWQPEDIMINVQILYLSKEKVRGNWNLPKEKYYREDASTIKTKDSQDFKDFKLMESTGVKDINGTEIFEGDFIKITYDTAWSDNEFEYYQVKYCDYEDYPAFDLKPWIDCEMNSISWLKSECDPSVIKYEVVGNIYENPELFNEIKS